MLAPFKWISQLFMHVCSFDANRLCMLLEKKKKKTLKNDFENFPP